MVELVCTHWRPIETYMLEGKRTIFPPKAIDMLEIRSHSITQKKKIMHSTLVSSTQYFSNQLVPTFELKLVVLMASFFGDLKLSARSELLITRGISLVISAFSYGLYDNMDELKLESDSVLPHVRTDIVKYLKNSRNFSIERMQLNKFGQLSPSIFYKLSGGIFEAMFSGVGGEILYKPFDKNYAVGLEAWAVNQREYDQMFGLRKYTTNTGHLSLYYREPHTNVTFRLKGGRFLAEDSGISFEFWRVFHSGFRLGAFFTLTDISAEEFGEGSFDKGFYFYIPIDLFSAGSTKRNFGWGLKPLTRDGGATLVHSHPLWGVVNSSSGYKFNTHLDEFYD